MQSIRILGGEAIGSGETATVSAAQTTVTNSILGHSFGKLGRVVNNPNIEINSLTNYAVQRSLKREVTRELIGNTIRNPKIVLERV